MQDDLQRGLNLLGLRVDARQQTELIRFIQLLNRWNRTYNLTAVRDPIEMVPRHLLDSLSISDYIVGGTVLDLGTGAGLPGIPLAITQPERSFTLLDSNGKKTRFVKQAVFELGLNNVTVARCRIEAYRSEERFDTVVVRAFAPLAVILEKSLGLLRRGGRLLAMKGGNLEQELQALPGEMRGMKVMPMRVPWSPGERNLVMVQR